MSNRKLEGRGSRTRTFHDGHFFPRSHLQRARVRLVDVNDLQPVQFIGRATRFGRRLRSFCRGGRCAAVTDLSPGPPLTAAVDRHTRTVVVVVLFPQKALNERVPGGWIVLGRAPSPAKARVEPLGLDDEIETRNVGKNDAHLFPATFVPSAAVLRPVVVSRRRVDLAVGPTDPTGRRRPTAFFTSSATAAAALSFFPSRRFAGTPDVRRTRRATVRRRSVQESVQNGMSAVGRFVAETYRSGRRRRILQQQFQGRDGRTAATMTFSRSQQARHVHVHPPSTAAGRPREVGDQRRVFPQYGAAGLLQQNAPVHADPYVRRVRVDSHHRFDHRRAGATTAHRRIINRERDGRRSSQHIGVVI